ncbi:MAG: hypothetical protein ACXIUD_17270 [Mongoliitalea sp.]
MKNLVVPISIKLNSLTGDVITIGLLAFNERDTFFNFSYEKLKMAKHFLDNSSMTYIEHALIGMGESFLKDTDRDGLAFARTVLNEKYIDYLSKYSRGLLKIGEPKGFALPLDEDTFLKAFKSFVGADPGKKSVNAPFSMRREMTNFLKKEAFEKIDTLYTINPSIIPGIYAPHKLDFIGINGSPYAGLAVDFTKEEGEVDKTILTFRYIANGLAVRASKFGMGLGKYELYFNIPESKENKRLLDMARKDNTKGFEMIEFEKTDRIIKYIESNDFRKFSESELASA